MLSRIIVYPVKGCQGVERSMGKFDKWGGLEYDRWFCVVDENGDCFEACEFLNQRKMPELASLAVHIQGEELILECPHPDDIDIKEKLQPLRVPLDEAAYSNNRDIRVECGGLSTTASGGWHLGYISGKSCGKKASDWLTNYFSRFANLQSKKKTHGSTTFTLVRCLQGQTREVRRYAGPQQKPFSANLSDQRAGRSSPFQHHRLAVTDADRVRFHDAMPLLVVSENSFMDLEQKMGVEHFPIENFRPNLVVSGFSPWVEWDWSALRIGDGKQGSILRVLKACPRCTVPARCQKTGHWQLKGRNKLLAQKTLGKMFPQFLVDKEWGEQWQGPSFGMHAAHDGRGGAIVVGTKVVPESNGWLWWIETLMHAMIWAIEYWVFVFCFWTIVAVMLLMSAFFE